MIWPAPTCQPSSLAGLGSRGCQRAVSQPPLSGWRQKRVAARLCQRSGRLHLGPKLQICLTCSTHGLIVDESCNLHMRTIAIAAVADEGSLFEQRYPVVCSSKTAGPHCYPHFRSAPLEQLFWQSQPCPVRRARRRGGSRGACGRGTWAWSAQGPGAPGHVTAWEATERHVGAKEALHERARRGGPQALRERDVCAHQF